MGSVQFTFFLILGPIYVLSAPLFNNGTLQHVHVLFRHGDRSPVSRIQLTNQSFEEMWPAGIGQLTRTGIIQEYELGRWLRSRYGSFVPMMYNASDFHMRSTDIDRTLMSAQAVLAGFYGNISSPLSAFNVDWSPIPVHTVQQKNDILLSIAECPRLTQLRDLQMNSNESMEFESNHSSLFRHLEKHTNLSVVNRTNMWEILDALVCMKANKFELPDWMNNTLMDEMEEVEMFYWNKKYMSTRDIIRLEIGVFLHDFVNHLKWVNSSLSTDYLNSPPPLTFPRIMAYSAHDTDVSFLLGAFALNQTDRISYSASVILELVDFETGIVEPNNRRLFLLYKHGWEDSDSEYLHFRACSDQPAHKGCPLHLVLKNIEPLLQDPNKFEKSCMPVASIEFYSHPWIMYLALFFLVVMLVVIITDWILRYRRKRRYL